MPDRARRATATRSLRMLVSTFARRRAHASTRLDGGAAGCPARLEMQGTDLTRDAGASPVRSVLVLGGARSGKSRYAQPLAEGCGRPPVLVATAAAGDDEMRE